MTFRSLFGSFRQQAALQAEIIALRHQLTVLQRNPYPKRLLLNRTDRWFWVWLSRLWSGWRSALIIVKPETFIGWHRQGFRKPPSQTWKTFLHNHVSQLVSIDFFTVHTIWFEVLFVFVVLAHDRRRVLHSNVTAHPTAAWTAQQMVEAFPFDSAPKYLLRDRDRIYGDEFRRQVELLGIKEVLSAPRSAWQRAYVERVIGSIRRECLDHVIIFNEESLRRALRSYFRYYHGSRLHLALNRDSPDSRMVQSSGKVIAIAEVGGPHHRYERRAA